MIQLRRNRREHTNTPAVQRRTAMAGQRDTCSGAAASGTPTLEATEETGALDARFGMVCVTVETTDGLAGVYPSPTRRLSMRPVAVRTGIANIAARPAHASA
jgi:hypothetical protein